MKSLEQIEREEQVKCDAYVREQMALIDRRDLENLHEGALKHFFSVAFWRNRAVTLIAEKSENALPAIKAKREELDRVRAAAEDSHRRSSDYHTPPSTYVSSLEGQVAILDWVITRLE
jgi:hypothetical protein